MTRSSRTHHPDDRNVELRVDLGGAVRLKAVSGIEGTRSGVVPHHPEERVALPHPFVVQPLSEAGAPVGAADVQHLQLEPGAHT
jgi:hypothetical protein